MCAKHEGVWILFKATVYQMTHVDIYYHANYCRSERRAAGCLPLALGPAFTQGAPTICIIATPARTTDKQACGWTQQDTGHQLPWCVRVCVCGPTQTNKHPYFGLCITVVLQQLASVEVHVSLEFILFIWRPLYTHYILSFLYMI